MLNAAVKADEPIETNVPPPPPTPPPQRWEGVKEAAGKASDRQALDKALAKRR